VISRPRNTTLFCRFESVPAEEMSAYTWLRPETVAEIKFAEWTTAALLRHAEFVTLRDDKSPADVTREDPL
jgi:ATP-dependent DNA ligase